MKKFKYIGTTVSGQKIEGIVMAEDKSSAIMEARKSVDMVESIKEDSKSSNLLNMEIGGTKLDMKALSLICRQFSIILHAGLPIGTTIRMIANQTDDKYFKKLLLEVSDDVTSGSSIADSFQQRDPKLPVTFTETIRAGESSGKLDVAFDRLSTYYTKKSSTAGKVKSALIYPIVVICMAVVVVAILMIKAVPTFKQTFEDLGSELPGVTKALISVSDFFVNYWWVLALIIAVLVIMFKLWTGTEEGKYKWNKFKLNIPVLGRIELMSSASEFANSFATMLASGIPAIKALTITARSISNACVSKDILNASGLVESGYRISDSLKEKTVLPDMLTDIVGVGEESGSLENVLTVCSEYYDEEVDTATKNALAVLEPATIVVLAVIVLFLLLAVYLPMFSMYDSI